MMRCIQMCNVCVSDNIYHTESYLIMCLLCFFLLFFIYLSPCLSVSASFSLSQSVYLFLCQSLVYLFLCRSLLFSLLSSLFSLSLSLSLSASLSLSVSLFVSLSVSLCLSLCRSHSLPPSPTVCHKCIRSHTLGVFIEANYLKMCETIKYIQNIHLIYAMDYNTIICISVYLFSIDKTAVFFLNF